jgi:hypothetical protein
VEAQVLLSQVPLLSLCCEPIKDSLRIRDTSSATHFRDVFRNALDSLESHGSYWDYSLPTESLVRRHRPLLSPHLNLTKHASYPCSPQVVKSLPERARELAGKTVVL